MHKQIQLGAGIYVTDFRNKNNPSLKGVAAQQIPSSLQKYTKDIGMLIDKIRINDSKINQLLFSNEAMQEQQQWQNDQVLLQAIQQNFELMLKFNQQIKQWVLELDSVKYKPEDDKVQQLIDPSRIANREKQISQKFNSYLEQHGIKKNQQGQNKGKNLAQISSQSDSQQDYKAKEQNHQKAAGQKKVQKEEKDKKQQNQEDKNQGIYL